MSKKSIYITDKKYRWGAGFIVVFCGLLAWAGHWKLAVGFTVMVAAIAVGSEIVQKRKRK